MRKIINFVLLLVVLAGIIAACDDQKTMQEYLREETKAIERYIASQGIKVVNTYPADSTFEENVYYKTTDGLYMHVVDKGNTTQRAIPYTSEVLVRFDYYLSIKSFVSGSIDSIVPPYTYFPFQFLYGIPATDPLQFACNGWNIPLQYVGEGAVVDLIVPSSLGSSANNTSFQPVFYKNLWYSKFN